MFYAKFGRTTEFKRGRYETISSPVIRQLRIGSFVEMYLSALERKFMCSSLSLSTEQIKQVLQSVIFT